MSVTVDRQVACESEAEADSPTALPETAALEHWLSAAVGAADGPSPAEMTVRIVDEAESAALNGEYRGRNAPTNVLSFPFEWPPELAGVDTDDSPRLLGDLVVCAPVVRHEAAEQGKVPEAHWAHMVVHGALHLLGHDHEDDTEAEAMEALERRILSELGYPDPYLQTSHD